MIRVIVKGVEFKLCATGFNLYGKHNWFLCEPAKGYRYLRRNAKNGNKGEKVMFHRELLSLSVGDGLQVDHINGDTTDNRLENLRVCKPEENYRNRKKSINKISKYIGVSYFSGERAIHKRWRAHIRINQRPVHIGSYETELQAALARDEAAKKHYGDFTRLNFPKPSQPF